MVNRARPPPHDWDQEPGSFERGWQHEASSRVERQHRELNLFPRFSEAGRALDRSQAGPGGGLAISTCPTCRITPLDSRPFRVLLLRRLQVPLPLTVRTCQCGRPLDAHGHHRAACPRAGVLGRRGYAAESVAARICREASGRVATNIFARDLDLELHNATRRLEVVADGLPPFGRAQLVVDTWSVLFGVMGRREQGQREGMALRWQPQDVQKSGVALNWWRDARGRGWLCWMWRWGDDGREKHRSFGESPSTC